MLTGRGVYGVERDESTGGISAEERAEEQKHSWLQMMMNMVMQVIAQDSSLTVDDAAQMIADSRRPLWPCSRPRRCDLIWRHASGALCAALSNYVTVVVPKQRNVTTDAPPDRLGKPCGY